MDKLIDAMKIYFATNFQYYTKAHGYHVNVVGPDFFQYHKLFEMVYDDAQDNIDLIAEEIRTLQAIVPFSMKRISTLAKVSDASDTPAGLEMVKELLADTEIVCETIRVAHALAQKENCYGLINYLEGRLDDHYKIQWMLRSTLGK